MKPIFRKFSFREYQHDSNMCPVMIVTPDDWQLHAYIF